MLDILVPWILPAHLALTWTMVGLIWTVQCVRCPIVAHVGREAFDGNHRRYLQ